MENFFLFSGDFWNNINFMEYVPRIKEVQLAEFIRLYEEHKNVLVLRGARQVGKSTLVDKMAALSGKRVTKFDFEKQASIAEKIDQTKDFDEFTALLKEDYSFLPSVKTILFIDEAQISRRLGQYIRFMKEDWEGATVIISGSLVGEIHRHDARQPVGRETFLELWPFTFKEFLSATGRDSLVKGMENFAPGQTISALQHDRFLENYDVYLKVGGLPGVVDAYLGGKNWYDARIDIYKNYENDFLRYFGEEDANLFARTMGAVAANTGSPSKYTQIISANAPGYKKVAGVLARLELWNIIIKVEQVGKSPENTHIAPKRYLFDTGILNYLRFKGRPHFDVSELFSADLRTAIGGMIENAVAIALKNQSREIVGIRPTKNTEIDFAIKTEDLFVPVECKSARKFNPHHAAAMYEYCASNGIRRAVILNFDLPQEVCKNEVRIHSLPVYLADEIGRMVTDRDHL